MIKNIINLSEKELIELLHSEYDVIEKLDMYYFRLNITKAGIFVTKNSTDKVISDIDCITNQMFKNIIDYSKEYEAISDQILDIYGDCRIGIFYNPPHTISNIFTYKYNNCTRAKMYSYSPSILKNDLYKTIGTFILSDIYTSIKALNTEKNYNRLIKSINDSGILLFPKPTIMHIEKLSVTTKKIIRTINAIKELKPDNKTARFQLYRSLINLLCNKNYTEVDRNLYAKTLNYCEGIIIRSKTIQAQILINPVAEVEKEPSKLIYRDITLASFAAEMMKDDSLLDYVSSSNKSYIDKVSELFVKYIESTDLLSKYSIDAEDLLPPGTDPTIGDIDYSHINNNSVVTICKYNSTYKNIFRLLLHTLSKKISDNKFSELPDNISSYLNKLIIALKYRNYKEIAYELYKSQKTN